VKIRLISRKDAETQRIFLAGFAALNEPVFEVRIFWQTSVGTGLAGHGNGHCLDHSAGFSLFRLLAVLFVTGHRDHSLGSRGRPIALPFLQTALALKSR